MPDTHAEKIKVVVAIDFSDDIIEQIRAVSPRLHVTRHFPEVPESAWVDAEILYTVRHFPQPEQAPHLRWIQLNSAGIEHTLKHRIVQAEDVIVTSTSGMHTRHMAQFCLMMMLAFHFKMPLMMQDKAKILWRENRAEAYAPEDLHKQTVGIVGYGSIGRELARLAKAIGMTVLVSKRDVMHPAETAGDYSPPGTGDPTGDLPDRIYPVEALATMAKDCDYLVVIVPMTEQTRHLINERVLAAMKPNAILVNVARGGVVDEAALISALAANKIGGAALDVFETEPLPAGSPLWNLDNVIISPHISGNSRTYHEKAAELFIENLKLYLEKRPLLNQFNRQKGY